MEFADYRIKAIRYWEIRRIVWNIILVPPSVFAYLFAAGIAVGIGDRGQFGYPVVGLIFCLAALVANLCYSLVYVIEFWMAGRNREEAYRITGRPMLFLSGCLIGVIFALIGGQSIAIAQYPA